MLVPTTAYLASGIELLSKEELLAEIQKQLEYEEALKLENDQADLDIVEGKITYNISSEDL